MVLARHQVLWAIEVYGAHRFLRPRVLCTTAALCMNRSRQVLNVSGARE